MAFTTIPIVFEDVQFDQLDDLIEFDRLYLISGSEIPDHDAPPLMTREELQIAKHRGDKICWILTSEGDRAGYYWTEIREQTLFLSGLVISSLFRGKRIGPHVLNLIEDSAKVKGLNRCALAVSRFNKHAIHVYSSRGYKIIKEELNYFGAILPNRSRYIMEKELEQVL